MLRPWPTLIRVGSHARRTPLETRDALGLTPQPSHVMPACSPNLLMVPVPRECSSAHHCSLRLAMAVHALTARALHTSRRAYRPAASRSALRVSASVKKVLVPIGHGHVLPTLPCRVFVFVGWAGRCCDTVTACLPPRRCAMTMGLGAYTAVLCAFVRRSEDMETSIMVDVLRRAGADVTLASVETDLTVCAAAQPPCHPPPLIHPLRCMRRLSP
jgi:hypothetical protein